MDSYRASETDLGPTGPELSRILADTGCSLIHAGKLHDGTSAYRVRCPSHGAKLALLHRLALWDANQPDVIRLAERVVKRSQNLEQAARMLHALVQKRVKHRREPTERFQSTMRTLEIGQGDCDDTSRAVFALGRAAGLQTAFATLGSPPRHVSAVVQLGDTWHWADASLPAKFGESPIAAAARLQMRVDPRLLADLGDVGAEAAKHPELAMLMAIASVAAAGATYIDERLRTGKPPKPGRIVFAALTGMAGPLAALWFGKLLKV